MISAERTGLGSRQYEKTLFSRATIIRTPSMVTYHTDRITGLPGKKGPRRLFVQRRVLGAFAMNRWRVLKWDATSFLKKL